MVQTRRFETIVGTERAVHVHLVKGTHGITARLDIVRGDEARRNVFLELFLHNLPSLFRIPLCTDIVVIII